VVAAEPRAAEAWFWPGGNDNGNLSQDCGHPRITKERMNISSLLVCADQAAASVLSQVLEELKIQFEVCPDIGRATIRLAQEHFDLIILDCERQEEVIKLLEESRASRANELSMSVIVVTGQESIRELFALGVNFVLYRPLSHERVLSTLRAAQMVLVHDKRRSPRAPIHTQATIDYAGVEQARATLVDIAEHGMAVNFNKKLPPACKVYFQFQLPGQTKNVRLSGQLVWQDWNGRAGIQFVDVPQTSRRVLQEWLKTLSLDALKPAPEAEIPELEHTIRPSESSVAIEHHPQEKHKTEESPTPPAVNPTCNEPEVVYSEVGLRPQSGAAEHRKQQRYNCRLGAEVYQQGRTVRSYCQLNDLSPGGCYLEMPRAFASGTRVEIVVRTHEFKVRVSGEVKASHPGYGMGVTFLLNTNEERDGVQHLLDFVAATAAAENS